jgi:hypothetical protein
MKKIILVLSAVLMSMGAMAQVDFGVKAGFDLTNFWGEDLPHGMKPSYQAGLFMEYHFNNKVSIAPEVVFASQGGKFKAAKDFLGIDVSALGLKDVDITFNTNYVNVPIMFKYYATPNFSIDLGPQVGFNVYSKISGDKQTKDVKDNTKTVDVGVGLGATYFLTENVFIQGRYTMGLTKAFDQGDMKNGNIQLAFGYKF